MPLTSFHPAVRRWFEQTLGTPTEAQRQGWREVRRGRDTLVAAPTGSGKTLAAFLVAIDGLVRAAEDAGGLPDETRVLYVSPLKALATDIHRNLDLPLAGIDAELKAMGRAPHGLRAQVRTGDTPQRERQQMKRRPPHVLVTTPESLYLLLGSEGGRGLLRTVRTVIVDEIHAVVSDKRGAHLALSLERLDALTGRRVQRIGLSATQKPIEEVAGFLVGARAECAVVDAGHVRDLDLGLEVPPSPLEGLMSNEVWEEVYDRLADLARQHRTTLVFVNTRRLSERVARHLAERLGEEKVAAHHGSLSKERRRDAEERLKAGALPVLVATASLELGIDIGAVDLVCQLGSPRSIAAFLQRVGRARHQVEGTPKGRLFPLTRDDLVECTALLAAVRRGELDRLRLPEAPLDILAQQVVAAAAVDDWDEDALFEVFRRAHPYRRLDRGRFDAVVKMVAEGFTTRRGRRGALVHRDAVHRRLRGRRGARLAALSSGGAIPDNADYEVILEPSGERLGSVNEDFAVESLPGDVFQLGNTSWRILRIELGRLRVASAAGEPPNIPFWLGEAPGRTAELSHAVSRLRETVEAALEAGGPPEAVRRLAEDPGLDEAAARQLAGYLAAGRAALGVLPTERTLVLERFFDRVGDMHLVLHAPFGSRVNRAFGLALRKRFCQRFNFELQAAATDDAVILSLGPTHSFALEDVWRYLNPKTVRDVLVQALLDAPMFGLRWRWNANRSLAVLRMRGGKRVPAQLQRMDAEDLVAVVFPDQLACLENVAGRREIPDHPLVEETLRDCLTEAMDVDRLEGLLRAIHAGALNLVERDLKEPSPLASEILVAQPYAYLDDAPAEERRTQAVYQRRWSDPEDVSELGVLDAAAVERVRAEAWPEARDADELHDALVLLGLVTEAEGAASGWSAFLDALAADDRAGRFTLPGGAVVWVAAERLAEVRAVHPDLRGPALPEVDDRAWPREEALVELLRGRLEGLGPVTAGRLAADLAVPEADVLAGVAALEAEGFVLRGRFTPDAEETELCERRLLARIHRATLGRLRKEIEPVATADYLRFLFEWQHVRPEHRLEGEAGLAAVLDRLEGFEAPAAAWEETILPARVRDYDPAWLDARCLSGRTVWTRLKPGTAAGTVRGSSLALVPRGRVGLWRAHAGGAVDGDEQDGLSSSARRLLTHLDTRGASFFADLVDEAGLLRAQVEDALGELVAHGLVTADGYVGLRALIAPAHKKRPRRGRPSGPSGLELAGRWSRVRAPAADPRAPETLEALARALLTRWGVVVRAVLARETGLPPWRDLLRVYHRLEARGEIRGGRFVAGHGGEQFALPEAVALLREVRRRGPDDALVAVGAADPLNLVGLVTPGARIPALAGGRVAYRGGVPVAVLEGTEIRYLEDLAPGERNAARSALVGRTDG